jgi:toxin CptA
LSDVHVPLRPSRALALAVLAGHGLALACVWVTLPTPGAAFVSVGLALSVIAFLGACAAGPRGLVLRADGRLERIDAAGEVREAVLEHAAVRAWWIAALVVRDASGRRSSLVLLPDTTDSETLRRLRAWVAARRPTSAAPPHAAL